MALRAVVSDTSDGLGLGAGKHYLNQGAVGIMARRAHLLQALLEQFPRQIHCHR